MSLTNEQREFIQGIRFGENCNAELSTRNLIEGFEESNREQAKWVDMLRKQGIKASHPNDGWVDRVNKTIHFSYPQFNDGAGVGDLVALGSHYDKKYKIVRLIKQDEWSPKLWKFEYGRHNTEDFKFEPLPLRYKIFLFLFFSALAWMIFG